ncbi:transcriptional regulator [Lysinibacillus contaminans]|uniref:Transcriptional regulator n=1 Tax=Lysinibacillus contaminans TaxID=1293441 RepID=A0ABR5K4P8_9BACI|nr:helix-turn-helix transcriptional regulator [Lysinibacillus contaminans]KOS70323.1 transcriptional regulator [Lysinibacillus contaminans]
MENDRWGRRIRAFRKLKRMQQVEFSRKIGISTTTLSKIERGERIPSVELLMIIAQALAIDIQELKGNGP